MPNIHLIGLVIAHHKMVRPNKSVQLPKVLKHTSTRTGQSRVDAEEVLALQGEVAQADSEGQYGPSSCSTIMQSKLPAYE